MKLRSYFFGALACLALASCSSDDDAVASGEEFDPSKKHYVSINIVNQSDTRAVESDFVTGSDAENKISTVTLVFFDGSGNYIADRTVTPTMTGDENDLNPAVENITQAVCVLENVVTQPRSVLAVINTDATALNLSTKPTKTQIKATIGRGTYKTYTNGTFVMSNSTYGQNYCETPLSNDNIQSNEANAIANPVIIYVERLAARIDVEQSTSGMSAANKTIDLNGENATITPVIQGFKVIGINPDSYLFKQVNDSWESAWPGWDDAPNYRSYWATSLVPVASGSDNGYEYANWSEIAATAIPAYNGSDEPTATSVYCLENTGKTNEAQTATTLIIAATLKKDETPVDLVKYAGFYYTKDNFFTIISNTLKNQGYKYSLGGGSLDNWATNNMLKLTASGEKGNQAYNAKLELNESATFSKDGSGKTSDDIKAEIKNILTNVGNVLYWKDGKAYYFMTIKHDGPTGSNFEYGVVRNHIYNITVQGVEGLGVPVPDPDMDIIPERPGTDESHVAAQIKVLKWKIVRQNNVTLQ